MMDLQADKPSNAGSAALALRAHNAKMLFYDTAYGILTAGMVIETNFDPFFKSIKDSVRAIEKAKSLRNYHYGMYDKEVICKEIGTLCESFSKFASSLSETVCMKIRLNKYAIMCGMANAKGIDHVHTTEIAKMLRNGSDGRVFEVSPNGVVKPKNGAADAYTAEELRTELNAIKALETELDAKNPLYADMLSLSPEIKHELALQAIINSKTGFKAWDDELIDFAYEAVKDFSRMRYLDIETTLKMLSDIEALKGVYSLSFHFAPKDLTGMLKTDDRLDSLKVPSVEVVPNVKMERR